MARGRTVEVARIARRRPLSMSFGDGYLALDILGVEGETVEISGQELLLLVVLFVVPMAFAAWLLRRS